jgi:hypothetical protein
VRSLISVLRARWPSSLAALLVVAAGIVLIGGDIADRDMRRWWLAHSFTNSTVSGLLVLAFTGLVADQVIALRSHKQRLAALGAQAAIVLAQASRAATAVIAVRDGALPPRGASSANDMQALLAAAGAEVAEDIDEGGPPSEQRQAASDEVRTYISMLLTAAPLLIDDNASRAFLEAAQRLARGLALTLRDVDAPTAAPDIASLDRAVAALRAAAQPLLKVFGDDQHLLTAD